MPNNQTDGGDLEAYFVETIARYTNAPRIPELAAMLARYCRARERVVEKAYGGCHNCYGKGYATINDRWLAHDTDQDIGTPGGTFTGGKDFAMKYCACERGQQLKKFVELGEQEAERRGRVDQTECDYATFRNYGFAEYYYDELVEAEKYVLRRLTHPEKGEQ